MQSKTEKPKKGWKDHLLRSGVPLEYEVARVLAEEGMAIDADFSFLRRDIAGMKEWSVDLAAVWDGGVKPRSVKFNLHLIVECKYRSPDKFMLFLPDPNVSYQKAVLGGTVALYDTFVPYSLELNAFAQMEQAKPVVYKGVELHEGGAVEEDLRHGIQQLRYAAPAMLRQAFDFCLADAPGDTKAIFLSKILVTNAPLRVLRQGTNIDAIRAATAVEDISDEVETVVFFSDFGPDYPDHVRFTFADEPDLITNATVVRDRLLEQGKPLGLDDPVHIVEELARAALYVCRDFGTQFYVTTLAGLPTLIDSLKAGCQDAYKYRKKVRNTKSRTPRRS